MSVETNLSATEAFKLLVSLEMKPFGKEDWAMFAGCETREPMIGHNDKFVVVLDGDYLLVIENGDDGGGKQFQLKVTS